MNWSDIKFRARGYRSTGSGKFQVVSKENGVTICHGSYTLDVAKRVAREVYIDRLRRSVRSYNYDLEDGICYKNYYIVFDTGDIFSTEGTLLHPTPNNQGYYHLHINDHTEKLHRIIAMCFIPNPDNKPEVNHIDGNKFNNDVINLEWVTREENIQHAYLAGVMPTGEKHFKSKLSNRDVDFIRTHYIPRDPKYGARALSKRFGVAHGTICSVVNRRTWDGIFN